MEFAKNYAIKNGPIIVEANTYRYRGHSMSDPGISYRSKDEVMDVRENRDPINKVKKIIFENNVASEDELRVTLIN